MRRELLKFSLKSIFVFLLVNFAVLFGSVTLYYALVKPAAEADEYKETFSVNGEAERKVTPDTAVITVGAIEEDTDIIALQNKVATKVNSALEKIKAVGIEEKNIQTSDYSMSPQYDDDGERIIGYEINIAMVVTIDNTNPEDEVVSDVIKAALSAGLNEIRSLSYQVSNRAEIIEELKLEAIDDAKDQAGKLAKQSGLKLGDLKNVSESGYYYPSSRGYAESAAPEDSAVPVDSIEAIEIQPGEFELSTTITLTYEIK